MRTLVGLLLFSFTFVCFADSTSSERLDQLERAAAEAYSGHDFDEFERKLSALRTEYHRLRRPQEEAWTEAAYGSESVSRAMESSLRLRLQTDDVLFDEDVVPERRLIRKLELAGGLSAVFRPQTLPEYSPRHDVLYYELSREAGFNIVPVTTFREYKGDFGTVQVYLEDLRLGDADLRVSPYGDEKLYALDFITWFLDRHARNWAVRPGGAVVALDNDMIYGSPTQARLRDARAVLANVVRIGLSSETVRGLRTLRETLLKQSEQVPSVVPEERVFLLKRLDLLLNADCGKKLEE